MKKSISGNTSIGDIGKSLYYKDINNKVSSSSSTDLANILSTIQSNNTSITNTSSSSSSSTSFTNISVSGTAQLSGSTIMGGATNLSNASFLPFQILYLDGSKIIDGITLNSGQLLIGRSGIAPIAANLTGTSNQINIVSASGSITISTPQNIAQTSSPTFAKLTLTNTSQQLKLGNGNTITLSAAVPTSNLIYTIPDSGLDTQFILQDNNAGQTINSTIIFNNNMMINNTGITPNNSALYLSSNVLTGSNLSNGQLLIGRAGTSPLAANLTGTTNQIIIANASGGIIISTPQDIAITSSPTFSNITLTGLTSNSALYLNASKTVSSVALTNGQLLIGSTGSSPVAANITGTTNQINIANTSGAITLSTPQDIALTSSPTFSNLSLTSVPANSAIYMNSLNKITGSNLTHGQLLIGSTGSSPVAANITGTANQINIVNTSGAITLSTPQDIALTSSPTFFDITLSGLTSNSALYLNASKTVSSVALTDGQLLIGFTGASPVSANITGTANQINITNTPGAITLATPQDIAITSTPTFADIALTSVPANSAIYLDSLNKIAGSNLTDGQLLIGFTGASPVSANITGTINQINITNTPGAITLATPQDIAITSTPTFADIALTSVPANSAIYLDSLNKIAGSNLTDGQLLIGFSGSNPVAANITGTVNQINITNTPGAITLATPQDIALTSSPTFADIALTSVPANSAIYLDALNKIAGSNLTDGQLLIGFSGSNPVAANITGTANQINITNTPGAITLATPQDIAITSTPTFADIALMSVPANSAIYLDSLNKIAGTNLTDGQLLIGFTGANPTAANITGTANQINITNTPGAITLATPQDIAITSTPTFADIALTSVPANSAIYLDALNKIAGTNLTDGQLLIGFTGSNPVSANITGTANQINITNTPGAITLATPQDIAITSTPTFADIALTSVPANSAIYLDSLNKIAGTNLTDGQLLIGFTGSNPVSANITGTANQINITNTPGVITLATPQDIAITSTPTFADITLSNITNQLTLGTTNTITLNGQAPSSNRTYNIIDTSTSTADFIMSESNQTISGQKTYTQDILLANNSSHSIKLNDDITKLDLTLSGSNNIGGSGGDIILQPGTGLTTLDTGIVKLSGNIVLKNTSNSTVGATIYDTLYDTTADVSLPAHVVGLTYYLTNTNDTTAITITSATNITYYNGLIWGTTTTLSLNGGRTRVIYARTSDWLAMNEF